MTSNLPNSVSLPSLKSASAGPGGGAQNGSGGLRHRGAAPVTLQQQQSNPSGGHRSSCLYQFLYCILSDQVSAFVLIFQHGVTCLKAYFHIFLSFLPS